MVVAVMITFMLSARQYAKDRQAKRRANVKEQVHLKKESNRRAKAKETMSSFQLEECHVIEWGMDSMLGNIMPKKG